MVTEGERISTCPFCAVTRSEVLASSEAALAFFDRFPVSEGHALVVPRVHVASLFELPPDAQAATEVLCGALELHLE